MALGSGIRKIPIPDPGSMGQKGTGSRIRIRSTAFHGLLWGWVHYFSRSSMGVSQLLFTVFSGGESTTFHGPLWGSVNYFSLAFRIQISIDFGRLDPELGGQKWPELEISFFFLFFEMLDVPFLRAEGFSCLLDVLYGGLGISKFQFLIKKNMNFYSAVNFSRYQENKLTFFFHDLVIVEVWGLAALPEAAPPRALPRPWKRSQTQVATPPRVADPDPN